MTGRCQIDPIARRLNPALKRRVSVTELACAMTISNTSGAPAARRASTGRSSSTRSTVPDGRTDPEHFEFQDHDAVLLHSPTVRGIDSGIIDPHQPPSGDGLPPIDVKGEVQRGERPCTQWVIWQAWFTQRDERVCPECGPMHGQWFRRGEGPQPPLHTGCRCYRRDVHRECVARRAGGAGAGENF
jgi:hypothetical protein